MTIIQTSRILGLFLFIGAAAGATDTPVTPNASPEAQSLLAFLSDIYGKKILSGQHAGWHGSDELGADLAYIKKATGKLPALLSMDVASYVDTERPSENNTSHDLARHATDWYARSNGIVSLCWHWRAPLDERAFYTKETKYDISRGLIEGTPEHIGLLRDMDFIAEELKVLRDAHVPVLWRPLHEANGRWFWWGAQGPEACKSLWRVMFERFTAHHGLTNLLWVFSPGASIDLADWYPGDAYVDIVGQDHYPQDDKHGPAREIFDELVGLGRGTKLVGFGENAGVPDPDRLRAEKSGWLFFTVWAGSTLTDCNTAEDLYKTYNHPYVLNLGELPDLKRYPVKPTGKAVKLGFPAPPGDVAVGGVRRMPLTVAVQDKAGRTVRSGLYEVALSLAAKPKNTKLHGTLIATTANGVATFPDIVIDAADRYRLAASAKVLRSATSPKFQVGPGAGLLREWWTNQPIKRLGDIAELTTPPTGRDVVGKAFEVPVNLATNFAARFRGYLSPPLTGNYVFWVASDGISELWLSSDSTPAVKQKIVEVTGNTPYCKWPHTHEAGSVAVRLEAGRRYYIEAVQRQAAGSAHFSVRWRMPNGAEERPTPAFRFTPFNSGGTANRTQPEK